MIHHDYKNYLAIIYPRGNNLFPQKAFQAKLLNELNQKHYVFWNNISTCVPVLTLNDLNNLGKKKIFTQFIMRHLINSFTVRGFVTVNCSMACTSLILYSLAFKPSIRFYKIDGSQGIYTES